MSESEFKRDDESDDDYFSRMETESDRATWFDMDR
jgi:hypothetical protein